MSSMTLRFTDKKARLILPARFASSAVLVEEVSENELRIRKAVILPEDKVPFTEDNRSALSDEDRDFVLSLLAALQRQTPTSRRLRESIGAAMAEWIVGTRQRIARRKAHRRPRTGRSIAYPENQSSMSA